MGHHGFTAIEQHVGEPIKLAFHAHALKSMSLNLGCKRIVNLSGQLEDLGRAGTVQDALPLVRELEAAFTETKIELDKLRQEEIARITPQI